MQIKSLDIRKFFFSILIGSLITAALVAVVTILVGEFNEIMAKVIGTLVTVVIHSTISFGFISGSEKKGTLNTLSFFTNVIFGILVMSLFTSIFGIWNIFESDTVSKFYVMYFIFAFAALHANILFRVLNKEKYIDNIVLVNYLFMILVVLMLIPSIFIDNSDLVLGDMYFRILSAAGIIDGTLTILSIIFYKRYMGLHPDEENLLAGVTEDGKTRQQGLSIWVWILIIYLVFQLVIPVFGMFFWGSY